MDAEPRYGDTPKAVILMSGRGEPIQQATIHSGLYTPCFYFVWKFILIYLYFTSTWAKIDMLDIIGRYLWCHVCEYFLG